jgi:two-component system, OmpR family, response regulator VicR
MLILTRKEGEQIVVPECRLTITVLNVRGKRVQLGVSAPAEIGVYRGEVLQPIHFPHNCQEPAAATLEDPAMSIRVLIADSDEYLLDTYREYLEQHGFEVVTATTGLECVERLRDCAPDVLVLEPSIPWGWGDGVLAMMHEESDIPMVPVIVLTYGRDRGVLYRLAPFKIDDYQVKPLRPKWLAERIRAIAKRRTFEASPREHCPSLTSRELALHK